MARLPIGSLTGRLQVPTPVMRSEVNVRLYGVDKLFFSAYLVAMATDDAVLPVRLYIPDQFFQGETLSLLRAK